MAKQRQLTPKQSKFVHSYVVHGVGARAAREAGYAPRSARITASRLLTRAYIQAEITAERRRFELSLATDRQALTRELADALDQARLQGNPVAMIAAAREIGRICGYYNSPRSAE
jgi:phage terminase small subunit